ncbi:MAG TPA: TIGR02147 family protein [Bdellovibrionota bacterium]|jgi:uncharacterized protein (TIGR02147 family)
MEATTLSLVGTVPPNWTKAPPFGSPNVGTPESMTVFEFEDFRAYLVYVRDHYPGLRRPITLERWAKKLNYRSPRSIAMVLKGQRLPSEDLVLAFSNDLKHSENERRYFELLVRKEKHKDNIPPIVLDELSKLNPRLLKRTPLEAEFFSYMADWYNYVILQLMGAPSFAKISAEKTADWLCLRLENKITREQAEISLTLLEKLKLLDRDPASGKLRLANPEHSLIAPDDVPSLARRRHHIEQMDQAKEALERQSREKREFTTLTLRVNRERLPAVKKAIQEFRDKFDKDFAEDPGEDVCQLNVQFFFHTAEDKK